MLRKTCLSWCEKHVTLNGERFRREDWPLIVPIVESIEANPRARHIIVGAVQTVKTLLAQLWSVSRMQVDPSPTLWYAMTDDQADSFVDLKLNPLIDATQLKERAFYGDKNKTTRKRKQLPSGHAFEALSAGPAINRQQRSAETLVFDEFWLYDGDWLTELSNRRSADEFSHTWREIFVTTAANEGHILGRLFDDSTQYRLEWKCGACGDTYVPDFGDQKERGGLKFECVRQKSGRLDKAATAASARWECPHCGDRIPYSKAFVKEQAAQMRWKQCNDSPAPNTFGWHIPDWLVRDWGALAVDWVEANDAVKQGDIEPLRKLILTRFAKSWKQLEQARGEKRPRNVGAYKCGEAWSGEGKDEYGRPLRFLAVDVQKDHYVAVARAWSAQGDSRLIEARRCTSSNEIADMAARCGVEWFRVFLDGRWDTTQVCRLCSQYGWRMVMGSAEERFKHSHDGQFRIFSEPREMDPFIGTAQAGGDRVLMFQFSKSAGLDRLALIKSLGVEKWSAASDAPDWYWTQTEAHYTVTKTKPSGETYREWHGLKDDHAGDCEVIQVMCSSIAGLLGNTSAAEAQPPINA